MNEEHHSNMVIKDRMITELSIENRRLKEDLAKTHFEKFQVEQNLSCKLSFYLFDSISLKTNT